MSVFVYDRATSRQKVWYWIRVFLRVSTFLFFVWYITTITPIEPDIPKGGFIGFYEVPMEYLVQQAAFQAKMLIRTNILLVCWMWELYLLACDITPLTRKRIWWKRNQDYLRNCLISASTVICGYCVYLLSF